MPLIKDDPANNKFMKNNSSDMQAELMGSIGVSRFKETYDAMIEGTHRARTIICSTVAEPGRYLERAVKSLLESRIAAMSPRSSEPDST